ncbi:putative BOI-related E3 ubiquitin-protein ligase 3 [Iris pallida]|uniref:BOI-related E3 ubiquitin-protein ligase 3 n=1 Tax=Iris pallida TaxID=29817 RepID=A0AAX6DQH2_IRIPA|nr:putative BOI-related E3 ubiquitin-protein ligase 3 [Iris pallida]
MAVQAHHHLSNAFFSPDLRTTTSARMNVLDELIPMQHHLAGAGFSGPQSDLTYCNDASGSRKRAREPQEPPLAVVGMNVSSVHSRPVQFRYEQHPARAVDSTETSTSGGPVLSPLAVDLYWHVHRPNVEIDSIIKLQAQREAEIGTGRESETAVPVAGVGTGE